MPHRDLRLPPPIPSLRAPVGVVDVRRRLEHAVEDDRVVLGVLLDDGWVVDAGLAGGAGGELAAVVLVLRDLLELLRAVPRELEVHHGLAAGRVDRGLDARLDEVVPGQLRRALLARGRRREVLEEVPELAARRADDEAVRRHGEDLGVRRLSRRCTAAGAASGSAPAPAAPCASSS